MRLLTVLTLGSIACAAPGAAQQLPPICARLPRLRAAADSIRHRDPARDAEDAVAAGERRLYSVGFGSEVPGTSATWGWLDSLTAEGGLNESRLTAATHAWSGRHGTLLARYAAAPGLREMPDNGHQWVTCPRTLPDGSVVPDSAMMVWWRASGAYAHQYNRKVLALLGMASDTLVVPSDPAQ